MRVQRRLDAGDSTDVLVPLLDSKELGINGWQPSTGSISTTDSALAKVSSVRSSLGAWSNVLSFSVDAAGVAAKNLTESASRFTDADMAATAVELALAKTSHSAGVTALARRRTPRMRT